MNEDIQVVRTGSDLTEVAAEAILKAALSERPLIIVVSDDSRVNSDTILAALNKVVAIKQFDDPAALLLRDASVLKIARLVRPIAANQPFPAFYKKQVRIHVAEQPHTLRSVKITHRPSGAFHKR